MLALDKHPFPSLISAGNDLNKIVRTEYANALYAHLATEAVEKWKSDGVFAPYFHQTGWVVCTSDRDSSTAQNLIYKPYEILKETHLRHNIDLIDDASSILKYAPQLRTAHNQGHLDKWIGMWNSNNGWCMARDAVESACKEAEIGGVVYKTGEAGTVTGIKKAKEGVEVVCENGDKHYADYAIMCVGAWADTLIDLERKCTARCWTVGHIQLTDEEAAPLRGMPVVDHADLGFFFEPSKDNRIKLANAFAGFTHYQHHTHTDRLTSIPPDYKFKIPQESHNALVELKNTVLPQFKDKEIIDKMICWCLDSDDGGWIIDYMHSNDRLVVATGDCGMAFKFLPTIGKYICDALERKLPKEMYEVWKWRAMEKERDNTRPGGDSKDLGNIKDWSD